MTATGPWQPSPFNAFHQKDDQSYCFNSVSASLFSLPAAQYQLIEKCLQEIQQQGYSTLTPLQEILINNGFVIPQETDQYQQEHDLYLKNRESNQYAFLCIVPNLACNLYCSYCFQKELPPSQPMSASTCQNTIALFNELASRVQGIALCWFGGEPLLALTTIESLSQSFQKTCAQRGIYYQAEMITNGTLLNPQIIKRLKPLNLHRMEITIDGLPEQFSSRKGFPLSRTREFYHFLFTETEALLNAVGSLILRINVDQENVQEAQEIVRQFKQKSNIASRIDFRLQLLSTGKGLVSCIPHKCYSKQQASAVELDFKRFLASEELGVYGFPKRLNHPCMAINKYAFTIDPEGRIGKCVPAIGHPGASFYTLKNHPTPSTLTELENLAQPYAHYDPYLDKTCAGCCFLPICLGQCPKEHEADEFTCIRKEKFLADMVFYNSIEPYLYDPARFKKDFEKENQHE